MAEDRKTQPIPRVYPFDRATIRKIVGDPDSEISRTTLSVCEVCSSLPDSLTLARGGRSEPEEIPASAGLLEELAEIKPGLRLLKCPVCGCLYKMERHAEFLLHGGEEEESLTRLQRGDAFELLLGQEAKAIVREGGKWTLVR